ncbi:hypothetical protein [Colwellia sp. Bg11-28]|uniref:hypothetical protein n=1 Tax=Colwellia sp. Bg11-28 TaxID=2058305 RepID=UPI000C34A74E|nr:hypothetical protein [Colwellia sp. Bg11-28]PKH86851.1 hypothetical protein CXF79_08930 [Colwellia sp. Bg11-28]
MEFAKLLILSIFLQLISSCAVVSYSTGSAVSLSKESDFDPSKTYTYYDDAVSRELKFGEFELRVIPYNTLTTSSHSELLFIPFEERGQFKGSIGERPFQISISLKGEKNKITFYPFKSILSDGAKLDVVKWRDPKPTCVYNYTDWSVLESGAFHVVKDRLRNQEESCMKPGWVEYLLVFDSETPNPNSRFSLDLTFKNSETNALIKKKLFFSPAKYISTQTH